jgi:mycothiol synthase
MTAILGAESVGERKVLALERRPGGRVAEHDDGTVVGVAPWVGEAPRTFEVAAVDDDVASALIEAVIEATPDTRLRAWSLRGRFSDRLQTAGFVEERELHEMRRRLPAPASEDGLGLAYRSFRPGDEFAWLDLNNRAFHGHPEQGGLDHDDFADRTTRSWWRPDGLRLAEHEGDLVGFCWTKVHPDGVGEIYAIAVDPSHGGKGWGAALVSEGLRHLADTEECREAKLFVAGDNLPALDLYRSLGFESVGIDTAWVRDPQPKRI